LFPAGAEFAAAVFAGMTALAAVLVFTGLLTFVATLAAAGEAFGVGDGTAPANANEPPPDAPTPFSTNPRHTKPKTPTTANLAAFFIMMDRTY